MNKRKMIIILLAILIILIFGFLFYQNRKSHDEYVNPNDSGILELGIKDDKDENSPSTEKKEETETNTEQSDSQTDQPNSLPAEETSIPPGGEAINNEDGSVNIVINENEETFGE